MYYCKSEYQKVNELLRRELLSDTKVDRRFAKEISYMRECNEILFIPYKFRENYCISDIKVKYDPREKLKYVIYNEKRLYFPGGNETSIKKQYHQLLIEQDQETPHRYFSDGYEFEDGMIFVDVGAAEGLLSLEVVDRAKEVYLFECDKAWIRALRATFCPWKDKVHIIPKYAGRKCGRDCVTLDSFFAGKEKESFSLKWMWRKWRRKSWREHKVYCAIKRQHVYVLQIIGRMRQRHLERISDNLIILQDLVKTIFYSTMALACA